MKLNTRRAAISAITLLETLFVLSVLLVVAVTCLPMLTGSHKAREPICMSHLRQLGLSFAIYADDYGRFPMQVPVAKGGTMELVYSGHTFPHFQKLSAYHPALSDFCCPYDTTRQAVTNFEGLNDLAISYFINADVSTNHAASAILTGDRFLQVDGQPAGPGLLTVTARSDVSWTPNLHGGFGNLAFADGHVQRAGGDLISLLRDEPQASNRLSIP